MKTANEAFFQVALALIPGLLFGGAVVAVPRRYGRIGTAAAGVIVVAARVALIIAIQGTIDPAVERWQQRYVVGVVMAGTVAAALIACWRPSAPDRERAPKPASGLPKSLGVVVGIAGLLSAGIAAFAITGSLDRAAARSVLDQAERRRQAAASALENADGEVVTARASVISVILAESPQTRDALDNTVESAIQKIDRIVQPVLRQEAPASSALKRARNRLERTSDQLQGTLLAQLETALFDVRSTSVAQKRRVADEMFLVNLSTSTLLTSEMARLAAKEDHVVARHRYESTCREARSVACIA